MAFATTVLASVPIGGSIRLTYGSWSGAVGDAAGTIAVGGRFIGSFWFKNDAATVNNNTAQIFPSVEWDGNVPGNLTVQNQDNVGTGSFLIFSLGN
jgi:hypothetical protein